MNERTAFSAAGIPVVIALLRLAMVAGSLIIHGATTPAMPMQPVAGMVLFALVAFLGKGLFQVQHNQGQLMQLFGKYAGNVRIEGLRWTNPVDSRRPESLRVRNLEIGRLKVNDKNGNPIEIASVEVRQVVRRAEAVFCVGDYENF